MRSPGKGVCQPQCESVKVLSPEIFLVALGQGFHFLEASSRARVFGECVMPGRGLSPWQVNQRFASELGRAMSFPREAFNEAEEVRRRYGGMAVGPTRSRGVVGVIPDANSEFTRRGWQ